jgi:RHS repeat-associated protein
VTVAITNSQVLTTTKYYDFGGQRIAVRQNGVLSYLHGDHLGSTSVTTSNSGAKTNDVRYFGYGGQRTGNLFVLPTDHTFTGQKLDRNTGLLYYGARHYDSALGMFISPDSIVPSPGDPQSLNRYAHVRNNPLRYTDPTGHWVETAWDIANIAWDTAEVAAAPTPLNIGALVVDVAATVLPGVPGGAGLLARGGKATARVVSRADEAMDATKIGTIVVEQVVERSAKQTGRQVSQEVVEQAIKSKVASARELLQERIPGTEVHHLIEQRFVAR